jgi:hypothetical protein
MMDVIENKRKKAIGLDVIEDREARASAGKSWLCNKANWGN